MRKKVIAGIGVAAVVAAGGTLLGTTIAGAETGVSTANGYAACIASGNHLKNNQIFPISRTPRCAANETLYTWPSDKGTTQALETLKSNIEANFGNELDAKADKSDVDALSSELDGKQDQLTTQNALQAAETAPDGGVPIAHVGGTIATGVSKLTRGIELEAGHTYLLQGNAIFHRHTNPAPAGSPETYGTLVLWADNNGNSVYDWKTGESLGSAQTGAIAKPVGGSIEASASLSYIVTPEADTTLYLGGFAYNSDQSSWGSGTEFSAAPSLQVTTLK